MRRNAIALPSTELRAFAPRGQYVAVVGDSLSVRMREEGSFPAGTTHRVFGCRSAEERKLLDIWPVAAPTGRDFATLGLVPMVTAQKVLAKATQDSRHFAWYLQRDAVLDVRRLQPSRSDEIGQFDAERSGDLRREHQADVLAAALDAAHV